MKGGKSEIRSVVVVRWKSEAPFVIYGQIQRCRQAGRQERSVESGVNASEADSSKRIMSSYERQRVVRDAVQNYHESDNLGHVVEDSSIDDNVDENAKSIPCDKGLSGEDLTVAGNGQYDSPSFTYSIMDFPVLKSYILLVFLANRHKGIRKLARTEYPNLMNQFDLWHLAKILANKIKLSSKDYKRLKKIVSDKQFISDLMHTNWFLHTSNLEDFHNETLKYLPNRKHFSYAEHTLSLK
ncbi:hypothetical protein PR048_015575 [Dryococelus australis]|uniref:Uncharacterized protein n=1 Tax=Dryococelus australis TaxID=614101 RepID=A0ABQ9HHB3_9NEOP|nr:hypothetical protein PR048_015575 [Dryococelus australis]